MEELSRMFGLRLSSEAFSSWSLVTGGFWGKSGQGGAGWICVQNNRGGKKEIKICFYKESYSLFEKYVYICTEKRKIAEFLPCYNPLFQRVIFLTSKGGGADKFIHAYPGKAVSQLENTNYLTIAKVKQGRNWFVLG